MLVPFLAADVGLIDFDRPLELLTLNCPRLADPVFQVPRRLLGNAQVSVQLHAGRSLDVGRHDVDCQCPLAVSQLGTVHKAVRLDAEILAAIAATERHCGVTI